MKILPISGSSLTIWNEETLQGISVRRDGANGIRLVIGTIYRTSKHSAHFAPNAENGLVVTWAGAIRKAAPVSYRKRADKVLVHFFFDSIKQCGPAWLAGGFGMAKKCDVCPFQLQCLGRHDTFGAGVNEGDEAIPV